MRASFQNCQTTRSTPLSAGEYDQPADIQSREFRSEFRSEQARSVRPMSDVHPQAEEPFDAARAAERTLRDEEIDSEITRSQRPTEALTHRGPSDPDRRRSQAVGRAPHAV